MSAYPPALQRLALYFSKLPGVGKRTAERLALACFRWEDADLKGLGEALSTLKEQVQPCQLCGNLCEGAVCPICQDEHRQRDVICVVEQASQLMVIENSGCYHGLYHVLGGKLSPLSGVGPEHLRLAPLRERLEAGGVTELILATSPDVEGEATAHYLAQEFSGFPLRMSRIAAGVPIGSDLTYADSATLTMALDGRRVLIREKEDWR